MTKEEKKEYDRKRYQQTKEKQLAYSKMWRENNREKRKAYEERNKEHRSKIRKEYHDTKGKFTQASKRYNISIEKAKELYSKTHCEICNDEFELTPYIDHCHETDKVRGVLCMKCNSALGLFKDNIDILKKAIKYIKKHK